MFIIFFQVPMCISDILRYLGELLPLYAYGFNIFLKRLASIAIYIMYGLGGILLFWFDGIEHELLIY